MLLYTVKIKLYSFLGDFFNYQLPLPPHPTPQKILAAIITGTQQQM